MRIENKFNIGDHVYIITDRFYDFELSLEENKLIKL